MHQIAKNDQALNLFNRVCSLESFLTKINVFIIPIKMTLFINMESKCLWGGQNSKEEAFSRSHWAWADILGPRSQLAFVEYSGHKTM